MGCFDFSKFFLDEKMGFNRIFRWFDRVQDLDSARACSPVFESNQFSFVPNRKGNIFRQDVHSVNRSRVVFLWGVFPCIEFSSQPTEGKGFVLNLCSGFSTSFCVLRSTWESLPDFVQTSYEWWQVDLGSSSPSAEREPYKEAREREGRSGGGRPQ